MRSLLDWSLALIGNDSGQTFGAESDGVFHVLAPLRVNNLPTIKPARKRFVVVLKRRELAHMGSNGTAHLWHT